MPAKYMVTMPPGAPVPGLGFVKPGDIFSAPEGYVPSRTFRPVNEEAKVEIEKVYAAEAARLEKALAKAKKDEAKEEIRDRIDRLEEQREKHVAILQLVMEEPKVEKGLTLRELAELATAPGAAPVAAPAKPVPSGKRAADK